MPGPLVKQLEQSDFRATFATAFGEKPIHFESLSLSEEMPPLSYEMLLTLIEHNSFMEMHPHNWRKSFEVLAPSIRLAKNGSLIDQIAYQRNGFDEFGVGVNHFSVERIRTLVADGATLIFNSIDKVVSTLGDDVAKVRGALGALCSLSAYYTPASSCGFEPHWDDHDVIVFQIEGIADWRLLENTTQSPHRSIPDIAGAPPPADRFQSIHVGRGEALYIPRGHWHFKRPTNHHSLHLTLGIHLPTLAEKLSGVLLSSHNRASFRSRVISEELGALGVPRPDLWEQMVMPSLGALREEIEKCEHRGS